MTDTAPPRVGQALQPCNDCKVTGARLTEKPLDPARSPRAREVTAGVPEPAEAHEGCAPSEEKRAAEETKGAVAQPSAALRRVLAAMAAAGATRPASEATAPPKQPARYVLTGGGSGIGKSAYTGCVVEYVLRERKKSFEWCTVRVVSLADNFAPAPRSGAAPAVGDEISWNRAYLKARDSRGRAPTWEELEGNAALPNAAADSAPRPELAPRVMPPLPPSQSGVVRDPRCLLVLYDSEVYDCDGRSNPDSYIAEIAATALICDAAGAWSVPTATGRFSALGAPEGNSRAALSASDTAGFLRWLESMSTAAGGKPITLLAHNGPRFDWKHLRPHLLALDLALPLCVGGLGDTETLFVAEKHRELLSLRGKQLWSMENVYKCRFGTAALTSDGKHPDAHSAVGDVAAMERIFHDVCRKNDAEWVVKEVLRCAAGGAAQLAMLQRRGETGRSDPVAPATPQRSTARR